MVDVKWGVIITPENLQPGGFTVELSSYHTSYHTGMLIEIEVYLSGGNFRWSQYFIRKISFVSLEK